MLGPRGRMLLVFFNAIPLIVSREKFDLLTILFMKYPVFIQILLVIDSYIPTILIRER